LLLKSSFKAIIDSPYHCAENYRNAASLTIYQSHRRWLLPSENRTGGTEHEVAQQPLDIREFARPVINAFGKTIAVVGITSSTRRITKEMILPMSEKVKAAASKISADMGFNT